MVRSALALAALATSAVPGLDVVATRPPQRATTDFQTTGLLDGGGRHWVVRVPLHPAAGAALEGEVALLANLAHVVDAGGLPFEVPRPAGFAALPEGGRAMVYRELVGRPVDLGRLTGGPGLSAELGRAIAAFHELDPAVVADSGLPVYDAEAYRKRCLAEVDEAARTGHVPSVLLNRWERTLEDVALWRFGATPVHGDLAPEHVLVLDGRVSALLSLADVHVGDPAEDLAWLTAAAPEDSVDAIVEAYTLARTEGADAHLLDRALLVSELALARWLLHGVRHGEQAVVEDAAAMLGTLAADVEDAPPIGAHEPVVVQDYAVAWPDADPAVEVWEPGDEGPAEALEEQPGRAAGPGVAGPAAGKLSDTAVTEPLNLGDLPDFLQPAEQERPGSAAAVPAGAESEDRAGGTDGHGETVADGDDAPDEDGDGRADDSAEADEHSAT